MNEFAQIRDVARRSGHDIHGVGDSYRVTHCQSRVYFDAPRISVSRSPGESGISVRYNLSISDGGVALSTDQALAMITSGVLKPQHAQQRILDAARASGYDVTIAGVNSFLVAQVGDEAQRDPASSYLIVTATGVLHFTGACENGVITADRAVEMIEAAKL